MCLSHRMTGSDPDTILKFLILIESIASFSTAITAVGLAAILSGSDISYSLSVTVFLIVAVSFFAHGRMLEGRSDAQRIEWIRLAALCLIAVLAPSAWHEWQIIFFCFIASLRC